MNEKYYLAGGLVVIVLGIAAWLFLNNQGSAMKKFAAGGPATVKGEEISANGNITKLPPQFCPKPEDLIKEGGVKWTTTDHRWENYTPSSATKILNFVGAQWIGIKVGKIICLYQTNEAVAFPVALEQTRSQLIMEPKGAAWSALVGNLRFCESASPADCHYFVKPPEDTTNVYKEIEYAPAERNSSEL